jgi:hypothetical protein
MREKLNNDPKTQIGAVIVLILLAVVLLMKASGGSEGGEEAPGTEATVSIEGTGASGTATGATPGEAVEGAVEGAVEAAVAEASATSVAAQIPKPPLPAPVAAAYDSGKTVALLIVHDGGIDDKLVKASTQRLAGFADVTSFIVPAKQIARYGAITLGVDVSQVPALVVMRPKRLSEGIPQATVSYGFETEQGIEQAMRDASYNGPDATYHPN